MTTQGTSRKTGAREIVRAGHEGRSVEKRLFHDETAVGPTSYIQLDMGRTKITFLKSLQRLFVRPFPYAAWHSGS